MLGEHISPQSEVIRAILFEDSPCCAIPHLHLVHCLLGLRNRKLASTPQITGPCIGITCEWSAKEMFLAVGLGTLEAVLDESSLGAVDGVAATHE